MLVEEVSGYFLVGNQLDSLCAASFFVGNNYMCNCSIIKTFLTVGNNCDNILSTKLILTKRRLISGLQVASTTIPEIAKRVNGHRSMISNIFENSENYSNIKHCGRSTFINERY